LPTELCARLLFTADYPSDTSRDIPLNKIACYVAFLFYPMTICAQAHQPNPQDKTILCDKQITWCVADVTILGNLQQFY
jgi:hypothetical protein